MELDSSAKHQNYKKITHGHFIDFEKAFEFIVTLNVLFANDKWAASMYKNRLSYDFASGNDLTPCIKIDKPLMAKS